MKVLGNKTRYFAIGIFSLVQFGLFACASQQGGGDTEDPVADEMQNLEESESSQSTVDQGQKPDEQPMAVQQTHEDSTAGQTGTSPEESAVGWNNEGTTPLGSAVNDENSQKQGQEEENFTIHEDHTDQATADKQTEPQQEPVTMQTSVSDNAATPGQDLFAATSIPESSPAVKADKPTDSTTVGAPLPPKDEHLSLSEPKTDVPTELMPTAAIEQDTPEKTTADKSKKPYIVMPGDTLASIAQEIYGSAAEWKKLAALNSLQNPDKIFPGDLIYFEENEKSKGFSKALASTNQKSIQVQKGDTLSGISLKLLGHSSYWKTIWRLNRDKISDPNKIQAGLNISYFDFKKVAHKEVGNADKNPAH